MATGKRRGWGWVPRGPRYGGMPAGRSSAEGQAVAARDAVRGARGPACPSTPHPLCPTAWNRGWERGGDLSPPHSQRYFLQPSENLSEKPDPPRSRLSRRHGCSAAPNPAAAAPCPARHLTLLPLRSGHSAAVFPSRWRQSSPFPSGRRHSSALPSPVPGPSRPARAVPARGGPRRSLGRRAEPGTSGMELHSPWHCPRTALRAVALPSHRPSSPWPVSRRVRGACGERKLVCAHRASLMSAQPAHLNVLLVPSWHSLLPDRFLQSKHFGAKQLSSLSCRCGNHRAQCLEGCCGFSP